MNLRRIGALTLLGIGVCAMLSAAPAPEIGAASGVSALALTAGALLILRGRNK
jgi:hypothetical protein